MKLAYLAAFLLFAGCEETDKDGLVFKCLEGHWHTEQHNGPGPYHPGEIERRWVCDKALPLVRYQHKIYRLGEEFKGDLGNGPDNPEIPR